MTDINLLPWRELKREQEKKQFTVYLFVSFLAAIVVVFLLNYYANSLINAQTDRNKRLEREVELLNKQIAEIKGLKKIRQALIARMTVIQSLQATRTLTVHLFDELIKIMPDGVFLSHLERTGDKVVLLGYAESNTNISQLMRNIDNNTWIDNPELTEIKKSEESKQLEQNAFKLSFVLRPPNKLE